MDRTFMLFSSTENAQTKQTKCAKVRPAILKGRTVCPWREKQMGELWNEIELFFYVALWVKDDKYCYYVPLCSK